jgi:subtilisin family serine protease
VEPKLWELYEAGAEQDEVSVIIRLKDEARTPPDARVISRFGNIITARLLREDVRRTHDSEEVESMKASSSVGEWAEIFDDDLTEIEAGLESTYPLSEAGPVSVPENGSGVVVGICDWGFDFTHENFRNADGTTRLLALWDQGADGSEKPMPYGYGRVYTKQEINNALANPDPTTTLGYHPSKGDPRGSGAHGTHVADILAGNRREPGSEVGLASASDIVFVHLARQRLSELQNFGDSVRLLEGLDFVRSHADDKPLVAHFSAGMTGGPHDGTALFAQAVDAMVLERPGIALVQSVGNYASSRMHTHGRLGPDQKKVLHWLISSRDRTPNELEIWYSGKDHFDLALAAPNGARFEAALGENVKLVQDGIHWGTMYHRQGEPNSGMNHIDIFLRTASPSGRYRIELRGRDIVDGRFHAWIERDSGGRHQSHFSRRQATSLYTTNTICNSYRGIAVGAFDATTADQPATPFSSRGPTLDGRQKPELVAPGYRIRAARSLPKDGWNGEPHFSVKSGTSMAAPHVSGAVALMMQAAGRPLSITEIRRVLIGTADPVSGKRGRSSTRLGYGYLNTVAAVEAARRLGHQGSPEEGLSGAYQEPVDFSTEWTPRWIVEAQPFEHEAMQAYATDSENPYYEEADIEEWAITDGTENSFEAEEDSFLVEASVQPNEGASLGVADEEYDGPLRDEIGPHESEDDEAYRMTDVLATDGEDSIEIVAELDEWSAADGDEVSLHGDADSHLDENAMRLEDGTDLDAADEDYDEPIRDDMSPQEEEEEEAYRLSELYDALGELTEEDLIDG